MIVFISIVLVYLIVMFVLFMKGKIGTTANKMLKMRNNEISIQLLANNFSNDKIDSHSTTNSSTSKIIKDKIYSIGFMAKLYN